MQTARCSTRAQSAASSCSPARAAHPSLIPNVRPRTTSSISPELQQQEQARVLTPARALPAVSASAAAPQRRRSIVAASQPAPTASTTLNLPPLQPLNDDYERKHTFGDFANWLIPGVVMLGRYPYCEPSRCTNYEKGEAQLEKIIESGITTFVSLQAEIPAQDKMTLAGAEGFLPYKATAELIKSAHSPPPSMEVMMKLRNPTLDKFLPPRKQRQAAPEASAAGQQDKPSYELQFVHFPIVDLGVPDAKALEPFVQQLIERVAKGEKLYIHCWGGRGRAGTVGACFLGRAYGLSAEEALERVQRAFNTREDTKDKSPETDEQFAFVRSMLA